ncbi:MAG: hypothetical protein JSR16_11310 [Proteobacteria bacterium]|nr:hypothetical protein [Pseudomonadota bacterium]
MTQAGVARLLAREAIGAQRDVTLAELTLELFYTADVASETVLRAAAAAA